MTGNERLTDDGGADAAILVVVQVAPAYPNRRDVDEGLVGPAFAQIDRSDADIPRSGKKTASFMSASPCPGRQPGPFKEIEYTTSLIGPGGENSVSGRRRSNH